MGRVTEVPCPEPSLRQKVHDGQAAGNLTSAVYFHGFNGNKEGKEAVCHLQQMSQG